MSEVLNSYLKTPSKTKYGVVVPPKFEEKDTSTPPDLSNLPSQTGDLGMKVSFQVTADYNQKYQGKAFDIYKEKFLEESDYHKKIIAGTAGIGYNALLLLSVEGKVAQISVKAAAIGLSTTSLVLGDGYSITKAGAISTIATIVKPSMFGYKWVSEPAQKVINKLKVSDNIESRILGESIGGWQTFGQLTYQAYHNIPVVNPLGIIPGGSHYGFSVLPAQWLESGLSKAATKSSIGYIFGKKSYEPYVTGLSAIDQLHLQRNSFTTEYLPNTPVTSVSNYIKPAATMVSTLPPGTIMDTMDPNPNRILASPPPKEKTEKEKIEGFIRNFDRKKPQNIWYERYQRIVRPDLYASYDKAKERLSVLKARERNSSVILDVVDWFGEIIFGDIAKSLKNLSTGIDGAQKLSAGIDYNSEIIIKLAEYKRDLEAAGGTFKIESNGTFWIMPPKQPRAELTTIGTTVNVTTNTSTGISGNTGTATTSTVNPSQNIEVLKNVPAIRGLVASANKTAWKEAYWKFIKNNPNLVKGKWHKDIIPLFYSYNPKFAPKMTTNQKINQMRADFYANPSLTN
jgi:hypothetical protein